VKFTMKSTPTPSPSPNSSPPGSDVSFEALATSIRAQAEALRANVAARQPLSDDDWRSLSFALPQFDKAHWAARPTLNDLSGTMAVDHAYRAMLGRAPDADGLASGEQSLAKGMPTLLYAGLLLTSSEGRSRPRPVEGFGLYILLALAYKVAVRLRHQLRIPLPWGRPVIWFARLAAAFHRRWDANNLARWQLQSLRNTLASWQPVLERQAGQLGAAQQAVQDTQQVLDSLRQDLTVARARLNALGLTAQTPAATLPASPTAPHPDQAHAPRAAVLSGQSIGGSEAGAAQTPLVVAAELDAYYLAFEDAHRASAWDMRAGLQAYQPLLESLKVKNEADSSTPCAALDLGCGRGEWLVMLSEQGFEVRGIDASPVMVAHCQAQGLQVEQCDLLQALTRQADGSLDLLTAFHVAEHLDFATLYSLVAQAWRVLKPGGALLLETPNPENPLVGSHTFYHDPTHRNPLTPSAMHFLLGYHGFDQVEVLRLNPYPESARVPGEDLLTERVNGLLCGPQDFAVIGRRPLATAAQPLPN
jgi:SAM-dependent methyltransferase